MENVFLQLLQAKHSTIRVEALHAMLEALTFNDGYHSKRLLEGKTFLKTLSEIIDYQADVLISRMLASAHNTVVKDPEIWNFILDQFKSPTRHKPLVFSTAMVHLIAGDVTQINKQNTFIHNRDFIEKLQATLQQVGDATKTTMFNYAISITTGKFREGAPHISIDVDFDACREESYSILTYTLINTLVTGAQCALVRDFRIVPRVAVATVAIGIGYSFVKPAIATEFKRQRGRMLHKKDLSKGEQKILQASLLF